MSDLVERLLAGIVRGSGDPVDLLRIEAVLEIERLRKSLARCGFCDAPLEDGVCPNDIPKRLLDAFMVHLRTEAR